MQQQVTEIIAHLAKSHNEMARIIEAKRMVAVRMAQIVDTLPNSYPNVEGIDELIEHSGTITKSVVSYLNSLADFQESLAETMGVVMKEVKEKEEE
ncbi:nucleoside-diphosphate sugar epimerase [Paenibacillus swuensis]|uniref:Nucleoside-diphosphate sugar epimerase n=1 Tax=Paenibacillus swuensis TaxID=1178515 RepID=A0A172TGT5_9BACL|nr:nucleoside-diphosphate sugar epimerase [Paenibacillus swuensis]ANE46104.1 nucleoside-diphosphate sugar epimerase [Paenibacillus swuensis]